MPNQATEYANSIAKQRVASLCLALGWNSAHGSALEVINLKLDFNSQLNLNHSFSFLGFTRFNGSVHQTSRSKYEKHGRTG